MINQDRDAELALADEAEISAIIHKHVRSEPDKHFVERRWLVSVAEAAAEIAALRRGPRQ